MASRTKATHRRRSLCYCSATIKRKFRVLAVASPGRWGKAMAQAAQARAASSQTIEGYVGETMDNARMGPIHWRVLALVASGYFCDVMDFTIFGALVPDLIKSGFVTQAQVPWIDRKSVV